MFTCFCALLNLLEGALQRSPGSSHQPSSESLLNISDSSSNGCLVKETKTVREADRLRRDTLPCLYKEEGKYK